MWCVARFVRWLVRCRRHTGPLAPSEIATYQTSAPSSYQHMHVHKTISQNGLVVARRLSEFKSRGKSLSCHAHGKQRMRATELPLLSMDMRSRSASSTRSKTDLSTKRYINTLNTPKLADIRPPVNMSLCNKCVSGKDHQLMRDRYDLIIHWQVFATMVSPRVCIPSVHALDLTSFPSQGISRLSTASRPTSQRPPAITPRTRPSSSCPMSLVSSLSTLGYVTLSCIDTQFGMLTHGDRSCSQTTLHETGSR